MRTGHVYETFTIFFFLALSGASQTVPAGNPSVVVLRAGRLLDVKAGTTVLNPVIVIEGEQIKQVGSDIAIPPKAQVLDLGNATLMPGLIDVHTHIIAELRRSVAALGTCIVILIRSQEG